MARALASTYLRSLERRPMLTKSCTSFCTFSITDMLAQERERSGARSAPESASVPERVGHLDPIRICRGGLFGLLYLGPLNHIAWGKRWGLERFFPGTSWPMVITKVFLDQLIILPLNMFAFCAWPALITRGPTEEGLAEASANVRAGWWAAATFGWSVWPFVHLINFKYVPLDHRLLVLNTVSVGVFSYATFVRDGNEPGVLVRTLSGSLPEALQGNARAK